MKIGLQTQIINTYSKTDKTCGDIWGDEIMCYGLKRAFEEKANTASVHDKWNLPPGDLDMLINLYPPDVLSCASAKHNILWFQVPADYYRWRSRAGQLNATFKTFLFASKSLCDDAIKQGFRNCMFFPMSADHKLYKKTEVPKTHSVVFVGNNNGARGPGRINALLVPAAEFGLEVYGMKWDEHPRLKHCWKGRIHPHDVPELYNSSKIVLSLHPDGHRDSDMPTSRIFEALACGAFVVTDKVPTLQEKFPLLDYVDGAVELQEHLQRFLSDDVERERRAKEMHEKFLSTWTWDCLVDDLLKFIEGSK